MTEYEMKRALTLIWKHMVSGLFCLVPGAAGQDCRVAGKIVGVGLQTAGRTV